MKEIVFATNNQHKLFEVQNLLGESYKIKGLKDIGCNEDIEETEQSLEGNASIKSNFIFKRFNINCFADDTGFEVDALNGKPGVYSARYAGEGHNFEANLQKVLFEMQGKGNRTAQFRTVISLILEGKEYFFEGIVKGKLISEKRGHEGFGYDPIFVPEGYIETFAEMPIEEKNKISHRALATRKLINFLENN